MTYIYTQSVRFTRDEKDKRGTNDVYTQIGMLLFGKMFPHSCNQGTKIHELCCFTQANFITLQLKKLHEI